MKTEHDNLDEALSTIPGSQEELFKKEESGQQRCQG